MTSITPPEIPEEEKHLEELPPSMSEEEKKTIKTFFKKLGKKLAERIKKYTVRIPKTSNSTKTIKQGEKRKKTFLKKIQSRKKIGLDLTRKSKALKRCQTALKSQFHSIAKTALSRIDFHIHKINRLTPKPSSRSPHKPALRVTSSKQKEEEAITPPPLLPKATIPISSKEPLPVISEHELSDAIFIVDQLLTHIDHSTIEKMTPSTRAEIFTDIIIELKKNTPIPIDEPTLTIMTERALTILELIPPTYKETEAKIPISESETIERQPSQESIGEQIAIQELAAQAPPLIPASENPRPLATPQEKIREKPISHPPTKALTPYSRSVLKPFIQSKPTEKQAQNIGQIFAKIKPTLNKISKKLQKSRIASTAPMSSKKIRVETKIESEEETGGDGDGKETPKKKTEEEENGDSREEEKKFRKKLINRVYQALRAQKPKKKKDL